MKEANELNMGENISPEERARIDKILNEGFDPDEYETELKKKEILHKEKPGRKQRFETKIYTETPLKVVTLAYNILYNTNLTQSDIMNDLLRKFLEEHEELKKKVEKFLKP